MTCRHLQPRVLFVAGKRTIETAVARLEEYDRYSNYRNSQTNST